MAKLYFRHGTMNSNKSTVLIQAAHNYEERDQTVLVAKPAIGSKGADTVVSRLGESRRVDLLRIGVLDGIPVVADGLRTDLRTETFPGAVHRLAVAYRVEEKRTICRCGSKVMFNARRIGGPFVIEGDQVASDGAAASYESLRAACQLERCGGRLS